MCGMSGIEGDSRAKRCQAFPFRMAWHSYGSAFFTVLPIIPDALTESASKCFFAEAV